MRYSKQDLPDRHYITHLIILSVAFLFSFSVAAADSPTDDSSANQIESGNSLLTLYTRKGADTCLKCHDEYYKYPVIEIFYTKHGDRNNPRSPMAQLQCESCHGPGRAHATEPKVGQQRAAIIAFGKNSKVSLQQQNSRCLQCHNSGDRTAWQGSAHESQNMACVDCHTIHTKKDPIMTSSGQTQFCFTCHKKQRAEFARASVHPVRFGQMYCTQCHNPHGTFSRSLLRTATKNDTCYRCHAEKRGPYLWNHAPVSEDCGICHEHHGSVQKPLLKKRPPYLCQQCHSMAAHPSFAYDSSALTSPGNNTFMLAKSCLNCHFQVHGSNHPSGVKLMR